MPRRINITRRRLLAGAAATGLAAPSVVRAQGTGARAPLKVGVRLVVPQVWHGDRQH